jgi:hypothetical protein
MLTNAEKLIARQNRRLNWPLEVVSRLIGWSMIGIITYIVLQGVL